MRSKKHCPQRENTKNRNGAEINFSTPFRFLLQISLFYDILITLPMAARVLHKTAGGWPHSPKGGETYATYIDFSCWF